MTVLVGRVLKISPVENLSNLERVVVACGKASGKLACLTGIGEFKVDDLCEVWLPKTIVPRTARFAFMERWHSVVRWMKFKGYISEALLMPLSIVGEVAIGEDISVETGSVGIEKCKPKQPTGKPNGKRVQQSNRVAVVVYVG